MPKDDIEASFFQYQCQKATTGSRLEYILLDVLSMIFYIPTLLFFLLQNLFLGEKKKSKAIISTTLSEMDLMPKQLKNKFGPFEVQDRRWGRINFSDMRFLLNIIRTYPCEFLFNYKILWLVAIYSFSIYRYNPQIIFCSNEYSFASSVLTKYCEDNGVSHQNVLHGICELAIRYAFSRFHKVYVWDALITQVFQDVRCRTREMDYVVIAPEVSIIKESPNGMKCTYYLQLHEKQELDSIKRCLEMTGMTYRVRPHPRYNTADIYSVFEAEQIENPYEVAIEDSIGRAGVVISQSSTALYQATLVGVPIVIDDISNVGRYKEMYERKNIAFAKPHKLLSELIG